MPLMPDRKDLVSLNIRIGTAMMPMHTHRISVMLARLVSARTTSTAVRMNGRQSRQIMNASRYIDPAYMRYANQITVWMSVFKGLSFGKLRFDLYSSTNHTSISKAMKLSRDR